jgi:hypothetical protein
MLPRAADEDLDGRIIRGLRLREPAIDLVLVSEAGLGGSIDPQVLEWAAAEGRILVTQDEQTMVGFAWDRVRNGLRMPGVVVRNDRVSIGRAIDDLLIVACCGTPEDFQDQVRFLPI